MKGKSAKGGPSAQLVMLLRVLLVFSVGSPEDCASGMMISCFMILIIIRQTNQFDYFYSCSSNSEKIPPIIHPNWRPI